ncbi:CPBP family intramembrane glutamic endopeptidase [Candidatus Cardinium hertigii]|uniref:CPBP family intramembrane glutamic endopeptidase n=1 Tax=Candidatus Cardinium hertigii TaxID=247481 RepID=UPI003D7E34AC
MNATYLLLICTIVVALFCKKSRLTYLWIIATNLVAWYQGVINSIGIFFLALFISISYIYLHFPLSKWTKILLRTILYIFILAIAFHCIPGFFNISAIHRIKLSTLSTPFSMDLNFDQPMVMLMVYCMSDLSTLEKSNHLSCEQLIKHTVVPYICSIPFIFIPGYLSGLILFDPFLTNILWIWIMHNFFLVCMTEEVLFRGCLQRALQNGLTRYGVHNGLWAVILTSFLFGIVHFKGGVIYMGLATIAGFLYGYAYYKTGKVVCAMTVHFAVNLLHFLLFTYPMAMVK